MDKQVGTVALVLITILSVFVAIQPILPSNNLQYSELGILGQNQTIGGYPANVIIGKQISLYGYVRNQEGIVTFYNMVVKLGNNDTQVSNSTFAHAPILASYFHVLGNNQSWTFPVDLSLNQSGTNQRLIFELWSYNETISAFSYMGLWNQIWINVTSTA